jgi:hypothetical protein
MLEIEKLLSSGVTPQKVPHQAVFFAGAANIHLLSIINSQSIRKLQANVVVRSGPKGASESS